MKIILALFQTYLALFSIHGFSFTIIGKSGNPVGSGAGAVVEIVDKLHQPVDGNPVDGMLDAAGIGFGIVSFKPQHIAKKILNHGMAPGNFLG